KRLIASVATPPAWLHYRVMHPPSGDITRLLPAWGKGGDPEQQLFDLLEPELRVLASSALRRTADLRRKLQPEELVSEAYVRLKQYLNTRDDVSFENRRPFFKMVLKVMRHVLLDLAKSGGQSKPRTTLILSERDIEHLPDDKQAVDAYVFYETLD